MSEPPDDSKNGGKRSFLKNSRWGKVLRERSGSDAPGTGFKLNNDVTDFLKPSVENAAVHAEERAANPNPNPKIDVAIAQRFPDAGEVKQLVEQKKAEEDGWGWGVNGWRKPQRKPGLKVGFSGRQPEVMGEGGDECETATSEIQKAKERAANGRARQRALSASDRRVMPQGDGPTATSGAWVERDQARQGAEQSSRPQILAPGGMQQRRSWQGPPSPDFPPPTQAPGVSSPAVNSRDEHSNRSPAPLAGNMLNLPQITTSFAPDQPSLAVSAGGAPRPRAKNPGDVLSVRKRELRSNEGAAFRRASAMIMDENSQKETGFNSGFRPSDDAYDILSRADAPGILSETGDPELQPSPPSSPESSLSSLDEPNPFADPKYMKKNLSREVTPETKIVPPSPRAAPHFAGNAFESRRAQVGAASSPPKSSKPHQPAPSHPQAAPEPMTSSLRAPRPDNQHNYMQAPKAPPVAKPPVTVQPILPQVEPPTPDEIDTADFFNDEPGFTWTDQPPLDLQFQRPLPPPTQEAEPKIEPIGDRRSHRTSLYDVFDQFSPSGGTSQARAGSRSPFRDRLLQGTAQTGANNLYSKPDNSNGSVNHFPPRNTQDRALSNDNGSPQRFDPISQVRSPYSTSYDQATASPFGGSTNRDYFSTAKPSSSDFPAKTQAHQLRAEEAGRSRSGSTGSHHSIHRAKQDFGSLSSSPQGLPAAALRQEEAQRPSSSGSNGGALPYRKPNPSFGSNAQQIPSKTSTLRTDEQQTPLSLSIGSPWSTHRPSTSPQPPSAGDPAADLAFADFAGRVAHMKGVFRLAAEREQSAERSTSEAWLRNAAWWYLKCKHGLEALQQNRPKSPDGAPQELLAQPHVDLAKIWWILEEKVPGLDQADELSHNIGPADSPEVVLKRSIGALQKSVKALCVLMSRLQLMPPHHSLIQGQDITIWLDYPRLSSTVTVALQGALNADASNQVRQPLEALPLGDVKETFAYGRYPVEVTIVLAEDGNKQEAMPCMLSTIREKRDFLSSFVLASQCDLVNLKVGPRHGDRRDLEWRDVSWRASTSTLTIRLARGMDLSVRMTERDFRAFWNLAEYTRKVEHSLRGEKGDKLVHEARLAELQYADSAGTNAFPSEKLRRCKALIFARTLDVTDSSGTRTLHRGHRLVLLTDSSHKSLSAVSHILGRREPIYFEFLTDSAAHGMAAMVLRIREDQRQYRILLVFPDISSRQTFHDTLTGLTVTSNEGIIGKMVLSSLNIQPATQIQGFTAAPHAALLGLQWNRIGITNTLADPNTGRPASNTMSDSLRLLIRHANGCITDRLNLTAGEFLLRLPCAPEPLPTIQLLRAPQSDLTVSIDTRHLPQQTVQGLAELVHLSARQSTIRSLSFANLGELHAFQLAVTGWRVKFDGVAGSFGISRRMMVMPIWKKWEASAVRVQVVSAGSGLVSSPGTFPGSGGSGEAGSVQVLVFMEDFSHADAMCFQVKASDEVDLVEKKEEKGKGKKWGVKLVDAKFSLPNRDKEREREKEKERDATQEFLSRMDSGVLEEKVRERFVNLEGLVYAEEHDDITLMFETVEERDRFAAALPAAATTGHGFTLKRRI